MLKIVCDLCGNEHANPEIYGILSGPYSNMASQLDGRADVHMPNEWEKIRGSHVCERCIRRLEDFMRSIPKVAQTRVGSEGRG